MQLTKRMQMIADMVRPANCAADIGTDHGYIPIWLAGKGIVHKMIAADVKSGPLERAKEHILACGLADRIDIRQGDGLTVLSPGEADCIIIAGMGGFLMIQILSQSPEVLVKAEELVLSPQSDLDAVRRYIHQSGFCIEAEDMIQEDGKFYIVMRCRHGEDCDYKPEDYLYGKTLIENSHPILIDYLQYKKQKLQEIMMNLARQDTEKCQKRLEELSEEILQINTAISRAERSMEHDIT